MIPPVRTRLILGTRNQKKLVELRDLLADLPVELHDLSAWPDFPDVEETGTTFLENATLKATQTARAIGEWVLSEDSGLVVPALGGRPGIFSARYGGTHGDDAANNAKLLNELAGLPDDQRGGYYVCVAVLSDPQGNVVAIGEGLCRGRLCKEYRGTGRFGYDPLFLIPEYHATFGELSSVVKAALSHRAKAVNAIRPKLWSLT